MIRLVTEAERDLPSSAQGGQSLRTGLRPFRLLLPSSQRAILDEERMCFCLLFTAYKTEFIGQLREFIAALLGNSSP